MKTIKKPLLFCLCLLPIALIGGWFMAQYSLSVMDPALMEEAIRQLGGRGIFLAVTVAQSVLYAVICGFFGYLLAETLGLMRPFRFHRTETIRVILISAACGAVFSLDAWTFARWIPQLGESYKAAGSFDISTWIASVLYGGLIEEVMCRLCLMSLFVWIGWKLFFRKERAVPGKILAAANILAALLFAAGHLPATAVTFGQLTPLLVFRCFLMNGAFGLLFGRFYRKYGIQYAMLSHALCHLVSRSIWLILLP